MNANKKKQAQLLAEIRKKGKRAEKIAVEYLVHKGFTLEDWHRGKPSNKPYDILMWEKGRRWAFEVKGGERPAIRLANIRTLLDDKGIEMIGIVLVVRKEPYLFSYNKHSLYGERAWGRKD
jgi:HJR/Mrr/RecB family endonuclease